MDRKLDGLQRRSGCGSEEKIPAQGVQLKSMVYEEKTGGGGGEWGIHRHTNSKVIS
jgi:hypothetical protein